ncbi:MAG TPA: cytochrome c peroxidase [Bryobacteraceae bacterium]|nr:cytochrome c peroxidase [Bryobacteraceae bacterium]
MRIFSAWILAACGLLAAPYPWDLPQGFPRPRVPAANPMSAKKVKLGRFLFYDRRLSANGSQSCATCHRQELAFTDGRAHGVGSTGEIHPRGAMSLVNVAYASVLTWNNPAQRSLEEQALTPMFGTHPVELGLSGKGEQCLKQLRAEPLYRQLFPAAFPGQSDPFTVENVTRAIASFERALISARSPYDRYHYGGDDNAVSPAAKRGEVLYFSEPLSCFRCHGGFTFSDATEFERSPRPEDDAPPMHNNGLADPGKFKAPTLRNIALTAPYMHDGSLPTLEAVLDHYAAGGRHTPHQDQLIRGFPLSTAGRADLLEFLRSLTDTELTRDPRFADPWPQVRQTALR